MVAHRVEAIVEEDGKVTLADVPFKPGTRIDVILLERRLPPSDAATSLRGTVLKDEDPFGPAVPPEDWDALA